MHFVTSLIDLEEDRSKDKSIDRYLTLFKSLIDIGIAITAFVSSSYVERVKSIATKNVDVIECNLKDLKTYQEVEGKELKLPDHRTSHHDTRNFMILMNAKIEFIYEAMKLHDSSHYSWIDFGIFHVFKDTERAIKYLRFISKSRWRNRILAMPGCWGPTPINNVWRQIYWRFCGGFFLGDKTSLTNMYKLYREVYPEVMKDKMAWEVNFWAYLETECKLKIDWYKGDHNNTIIEVPSTYLAVVASLTTIPSRIDKECRVTLMSLMPQVERIYLNVSTEYKRFGSFKVPRYLAEPPFKEKVKIVIGPDYGPISKYLGSLDHISSDRWIFFCDDDQEYHPDIIKKMLENVSGIGVYQNRSDIIAEDTSGGLIHGYVGNLVHRSLLDNLKTFTFPDAGRYADDQVMSIYYHFNNILISRTQLQEYEDIFKTLQYEHEKVGKNSLAELGNRDKKVRELERYYRVKFNGIHIVKK